MLQARNLAKSFGEPPNQVLFDLSFDIPDAQFVSITGRSGSGKSTLLYIISTLDRPTRGQVLVDGVDVASLSEKDLHHFRNSRVGFVFQFHYLLPELTALENILMPARKMGKHLERMTFARELLKEFGLAEKEHRFPKQLSGGEQQRVAIARALVMQPAYIFADEPTGNLDSVNGDIVMKLLKKITTDHKSTVIYVTHDQDYAAMADRQLILVDGRLTKS